VRENSLPEQRGNVIVMEEFSHDLAWKVLNDYIMEVFVK